MNKNEAKIESIRHSLAHVMASAVMEFWPKTKLGIGPAVENGFYYDIELPRGLTSGDLGLQKIEARMRELIKENQEFKGKNVTKLVAKKLFAKQPYKLELIRDLPGKTVGTQQNGKFLDLCRGGHVKNTKEIDPNAFKLTKVAGAYWQGSEKNKMLTRIYGVAFETAKELQDYLKMQEEAEKRDHRVLGEKLDLFVFSELVGPGLPLFTPKGTILRDLSDEYVWQLRQAKGYERVDIPHITKKDLYEKSGHWDKFKDELFRMNTREKHEFALKPMNCPHHAQIFARKKWSYRELPQRYASTTKVYRDEQTGELGGLSRVRSITQDDAHVFCNIDTVRGEILNIWEIVRDFYGAFNLPLKLRLSLRDKKDPKKYLGDPKVWDEAEKIIKSIAKEKINVPSFVAEGEAAFYGPKLDFIATDSLGREWQVATIQLDMVQPERFGLSYVKADGKEGDIIMIHAAIMGSIERFLSVLIEHYAGAFPVWLSPVQIAIIPISEKHLDYAKKVAQILQAQNLRLEIMDQNETLGKKIREAEMQKVPYLLIMGDKEIAANSVGVRQRGKGDLGAMPVEQFIKKIQQEIREKN